MEEEEGEETACSRYLANGPRARSSKIGGFEEEGYEEEKIL